MTTTLATPAAVVPHKQGRGYFWAGLGICVLGVAATVVQFALQIMKTPWYSPVLATIGAILLVVAVARRRSIPRVIGLVLVAGFAGVQWYFLGVMMKLPEYKGPPPGRPVPSFTSTLADGKTFQDSDLRDGSRRVLVLFRGRW
jgi:hypothetical protein